MKSLIIRIAAIAWVFAATGCSTDRATQTDFSLREQIRGTEALVERITGHHHGDFKVVITGTQKEGKDYFALYADNGKIVLEGNNGVSAASALNHYLKEYCNWHYSWCGNSTTLPEQLPLPGDRTEKVSPYKYRYYLNYCTFNYTMSWWDFDRWQREIDFMAMNGINMPLAVTGQNSVWQKVYRRLGFTDQELETFFSGPAYFNWFWMGNLDGWGGPLPQRFIDKHEALQKQILYNERVLGMTPILPAFTGHVPPAFETKFPEAKIRKTSWVNFPQVSILDPSEELFTRIGRMFIEEQTALYGTNHYYTADTFNENEPPTNDSLFLSDISHKVYSSMNAADPEAVWVMQGWLFYHEAHFWGDKQIRALLDAVPNDRMIVLDLWSERYPVWNRTNAYYGKQWIWCMLHNFGQNITLSGNVRNITTAPAAALHDPNAGNFCGIGLTMEGIEQNPYIYALMLENVWRDEPVSVDEFLDGYLVQRYGAKMADAKRAWQILSNTVFENELNNGGHESIITGRPTLLKNPKGTTTTEACYDESALTEAWDLLMRCADSLTSDGFRYDLVDITRQVLADHASDIQQQCATAFENKNSKEFGIASHEFLTLVEEMDRLLATRSEFLLGRWLESAKAMGDTEEEKILYEQNARNLLTLWGDKECYLHDYACRQWAGMMSGFYLPRWQRFFEELDNELSNGIPFNAKAFEERIKEWEWEWVLGKETYTVVPSGDEIDICRELYAKYRNALP